MFTRIDATQCHRLVFWYDAACEWTADFDDFDAPGVEKLKVCLLYTSPSPRD